MYKCHVPLSLVGKSIAWKADGCGFQSHPTDKYMYMYMWLHLQVLVLHTRVHGSDIAWSFLYCLETQKFQYVVVGIVSAFYWDSVF